MLKLTGKCHGFCPFFKGQLQVVCRRDSGTTDDKSGPLAPSRDYQVLKGSKFNLIEYRPFICTSKKVHFEQTFHAASNSSWILQLTHWQQT